MDCAIIVPERVLNVCISAVFAYLLSRLPAFPLYSSMAYLCIVVESLVSMLSAIRQMHRPCLCPHDSKKLHFDWAASLG